MDIVASNNLSVVSQDSGPKAPHKFKVGTGDRFLKPEMDTGSGAFLALSGLVGLNLSMCSRSIGCIFPISPLQAACPIPWKCRGPGLRYSP